MNIKRKEGWYQIQKSRSKNRNKERREGKQGLDWFSLLAENVSIHLSPATCSDPDQWNVKAQGLMQTSKSILINQHYHLHAWLPYPRQQFQGCDVAAAAAGSPFIPRSRAWESQHEGVHYLHILPVTLPPPLSSPAVQHWQKNKVSETASPSSSASLEPLLKKRKKELQIKKRMNHIWGAKVARKGKK